MSAEQLSTEAGSCLIADSVKLAKAKRRAHEHKLHIAAKRGHMPFQEDMAYLLDEIIRLENALQSAPEPREQHCAKHATEYRVQGELPCPWCVIDELRTNNEKLLYDKSVPQCACCGSTDPAHVKQICDAPSQPRVKPVPTKRMGVHARTLFITHICDGEEVVMGGDDGQVYIGSFCDKGQAESFITRSMQGPFLIVGRSPETKEQKHGD
jgi:hypothetical protein